MEFRIRQAREAAGFTQKELAKRVGVAPSTFNGYENGTHDPKSDLLCLIAETCSTTVDYLLGRTDRPTQQKIPLSLSEELAILMEQLNEEGREKVLEYADDLVRTGKYIKSYPDQLGQEA